LGAIDGIMSVLTKKGWCKMQKDTRINVRLSLDQRLKAHKMAERRGKPLSQLVRELLDEEMQSEEEIKAWAKGDQVVDVSPGHGR
jgi:hypothetical protein